RLRRPPGAARGARAGRRDDARRRAVRPAGGSAEPARRARIQLPLGHHRGRLPRLGLGGRVGIHRHRGRPRHQRADDAGVPGRAAREAEALRAELPPALGGGAPAPGPPAGLVRRGRARAVGDSRVADRRLPRARGVRPDGDRDRRPSQPEADPPRRRLGRAPAAQGLPDRRRAGPLLGRGMTATAPRSLSSRSPIYEGSRIPTSIPTVLQTTPELLATGDILTINFGPNHPSTHGVLRLVVDLYGEDVTGVEAVIGYLHTGFEKNMEQKTWWKCITYPERIDYVSFQNNEYVFVGAVEQLLDLEVPPKATWMRTLLCELNRIHSHLVWLGTSALELGAI